MAIWIHSYAPKNAGEVIGQDTGVSRLSKFVKDFKKEKKNAIILYGPPGSGKTSSAYAVAGELGLELIEVNASDFRTKDMINERVGKAVSQMSLFAQGKIILIDEIEGLSGTKDRGGIPAVAAIIKKSTFPIIITTNDPYDKKFKSLRKESELCEFQALSYTAITEILKNILDRENLTYDESALKSLARHAGGDARAAVNDLQLILSGHGSLTKEGLGFLSDRNRTEGIQQALMKVFKTTDPEVARNAFDTCTEDLDEVFLWVDQNLPKEYTKGADLARAYEKLSRADVFKGRIRRKQHWRFMVYIYYLLSVGIAVSKDERYKEAVKYEQTKRILMLWQAKMKYQKRVAIAEKLAELTHCSRRVATRDVLPYLHKAIVEDKGLAEELDLTNDELAWLQKLI